MKKIIIWGYWEQNLGDDLFLELFADQYSKTKFPIYILTHKRFKAHYEELGYKVICRDKLLYKVWSKLFSNKNGAELFFKKCHNNIFVMLGGSLFAENKSRDEELRQLRNLKYAVRNSKQSFAIGSNFGPYKSDWFLDEYRELFRNVSDICFRDKYSVSLFSGEDNVRYAPDLVLSGEWEQDVNDIESYICIVPIDISTRASISKYSVQYDSNLISLCKYSISRGLHIRLLSFCEKEGDLDYCKKILKTFDYSNMISIVSDRNEILSSIQNCKKIYTTRFHAMILALYFSKNFAPIVYDEKVENALESYLPKCNMIRLSSDWNADTLINTNNICDKETNGLLKCNAKKHYQGLNEYIENMR